MDAGRLDRRIVLKRASSTVNAFNEPEYSWATLATVWAHMVPVNDSERMRAGETLADMQCRFTIRWNAISATVDPRDRLTFNGREFDINGVKLIGRNEYVEITATARAEAP